MAKHWLLVRHGETVGNAEGVFCGTSDLPLTPLGREQARALRDPLQRLGVVRAFSSPLERARDTAALAGVDPIVLADAIEWDVGTLEGRSTSEFRRTRPRWSLFVDGPPEGSGESCQDVLGRAARMRSRLLECTGDLVAVFSHGQFLRALVTCMLDVGLDAASCWSFGPARTALISSRDSGLSLSGWNLPAQGLEAALRTRWS